MIKVALKHFIYDHCVDVFFDKVTDNFIRPKLKNWLKSTWTIDFSTDWHPVVDLDLHSELIKQLTFELKQEADSEIFRVMSQWNDLVKRTHNPVIVTHPFVAKALSSNETRS